MSLVTLNNASVLRLDFIQSSYGPWTADVQLDASVAPAVGSQVSLAIVNTARVGTVIRAGAPYQQPRVRVFGGVGKLSTVLPSAKDYGQVTLAAVMRDILTAAGEKPGNLSALQNSIVQRYQTAAERASFALQRVFKLAPGLDLWCERDGTFSARKMPFTTSEGALVRGVLPQESSVVLFGDTGSIEPGMVVSTLYGDFKVERVQYTLEPNDSRSQLTVQVWYQ